MWEYTILREYDQGWYSSVTAGNPKHDLEDALNELGRDGWELVVLEPANMQRFRTGVAIQSAQLVFKRRAADAVRQAS